MYDLTVESQNRKNFATRQIFKGLNQRVFWVFPSLFSCVGGMEHVALHQRKRTPRVPKP